MKAVDEARIAKLMSEKSDNVIIIHAIPRLCNKITVITGKPISNKKHHK